MADKLSGDDYRPISVQLIIYTHAVLQDIEQRLSIFTQRNLCAKQVTVQCIL